jgi:hypothetical protein
MHSDTVRALALLLGGVFFALAARALPVNVDLVFGLAPRNTNGLVDPIGAVAVRLPGGAVGTGVTDGICTTSIFASADCLLRDHGWQVQPTVSADIIGIAGPTLTNPTVASYTTLSYTADPVLNPWLEFDFAIFSPLQSLRTVAKWRFVWDGSQYERSYDGISPTVWRPTWNQVFAVPLPASLPLVALALAALALVSRPRRGLS